MNTKASKNITAVPTIAAPTAATKVYTKPTKYPFKPDNTPTPKKKYTTARTTPKEEENNLTPWRPPVYISVKLRMTMSELCSQLHDFSSIIIFCTWKKVGRKGPSICSCCSGGIGMYSWHELWKKRCWNHSQFLSDWSKRKIWHGSYREIGGINCRIGSGYFRNSIFWKGKFFVICHI